MEAISFDGVLVPVQTNRKPPPPGNLLIVVLWFGGNIIGINNYTIPFLIDMYDRKSYTYSIEVSYSYNPEVPSSPPPPPPDVISDKYCPLNNRGEHECEITENQAKIISLAVHKSILSESYKSSRDEMNRLIEIGEKTGFQTARSLNINIATSSVAAAVGAGGIMASNNTEGVKRIVSDTIKNILDKKKLPE